VAFLQSGQISRWYFSLGRNWLHHTHFLSWFGFWSFCFDALALFIVAKIFTELPLQVKNLFRNLKSLASYTGNFDILDIMYIKLYKAYK